MTKVNKQHKWNFRTLILIFGVGMLVLSIGYLFLSSQIQRKNDKLSSLKKELDDINKSSKPMSEAVSGYNDFTNKVEVLGYYPFYTYFTTSGPWTTDDKKASDEHKALGDKLKGTVTKVQQQIAFLRNQDKSIVRDWVSNTREWLEGLHYHKKDVYTYERVSGKRQLIEDEVNEMMGRVAELKSAAQNKQKEIDRVKSTFFY